MNEVRQRILIDVNKSITNYPINEHRDLIAICVCDGYFGDVDDDENKIEADFNEVIAIVDKDWLFANMKTEGIEDPRDYLINEYTSDDSSAWFDEANRAGMIAMVSFN